MRHKNLFLSIMVIAIISSNIAYASYEESTIYIDDMGEAMSTCPEVCTSKYKHWTGNWWKASQFMTVCECLRDWPFCPYIKWAPPQTPCYQKW